MKLEDVKVGEIYWHNGWKGHAKVLQKRIEDTGDNCLLKFIDGHNRDVEIWLSSGYLEPARVHSPENDEEKTTGLKLEVGKTYRNGYGDAVKIVENSGPHHKPFEDDKGFKYTEEGWWALNPSIYPDRNLIEEIEEDDLCTESADEVAAFWRDHSHNPTGIECTWVDEEETLEHTVLDTRKYSIK